MAETTTETPVQELAGLSVQVARSTISVIDAITQRGAFRGEELSTIGRLRDQCSHLVQLGEQVGNEQQT